MVGARLRGHGLGLGGAERQAAGQAEPARIRRNLSFSSGRQVSRPAPCWKAPGIRGGARTLPACQGRYSLPRCPDGSGEKMASSEPPRYSRALESADGHESGESPSCHTLAKCRNHGNPFSENSTGRQPQRRVWIAWADLWPRYSTDYRGRLPTSTCCSSPQENNAHRCLNLASGAARFTKSTRCTWITWCGQGAGGLRRAAHRNVPGGLQASPDLRPRSIRPRVVEARTKHPARSRRRKALGSIRSARLENPQGALRKRASLAAWKSGTGGLNSEALDRNDRGGERRNRGLRQALKDFLGLFSFASQRSAS